MSIKHLPGKDLPFILAGWLRTRFLDTLSGEVVEDTVLPEKGGRLPYCMSGHLQFWLSLVAMVHAVPIFREGPSTSSTISWWPSQWDQVWEIVAFKPLPIHLVYDYYPSLITASVIFTTIMSLYLYISSFVPKGKILAKGGNSGYPTYDFFLGRELNPRLFGLDLKEFCELRPGMIGWLTLNLGMAVTQYKRQGSISLSMVLINALQGMYVWDALYNEKAILTTMDITTDGFGFMLCFGDLSWLPFVYSFHARYLVDHDPHLGLVGIGLALAVYLFGFWIFRSANSEKDAFRSDPNSNKVKHLKYMETKRGTKLLVSGWWGAARKINYTGDWLITLSWCMLCGVESPLPYFQALYFFILLFHRAMRDDEMCAEKYGDDWKEYKRRVPYLFIPYIF